MAISSAAADVVTTSVGLDHPILTEAVPVSQWVIAEFEWPGLAVVYALTLALLVQL